MNFLTPNIEAFKVIVNVQDQPAAGESPSRLRRQRQGLRSPALRLLLLPQLTEVHRARGRPVQAPWNRCLRGQQRPAGPSHHEGFQGL